jgi:hypothetical protein
VPPAASGVNTDITKLDGISDIWIGADETSAQSTNQKDLRTLNVETTDTSNTTGYAPYNHFDSYIEPSSGQAVGATRISLSGYGTVPATNTNQVHTVHGVEGGVENYGTGNVGVLTGLVAWAYNAANATVGSIFGTWSGVESDSGTVDFMNNYTSDWYVYGGTVNNLRGLYLGSGDHGGGTIVNRYGIYIESPNGTATGDDYGIYQVSANQPNFFGGAVSVATNDTKNLSMHVSGDIGVSHPGGFGGYFINSYPDPVDARFERINTGYGARIQQNSSGLLQISVAGTDAPDTEITYIDAINIDQTTGYVGIGGGAPHPLTMDSGAHVTVGGVWTDASSRELKEDIQDLSSERALEALSELEPKTYHYRVSPEEKNVGFIAEDVPDLVATNDRKSLAPMDIVGVLTKVVQDQQDQIEAQNQRLEQLEATLKNL